MYVKRPEERLDRNISTRLTREEYAALRKLAQEEGRTVSDMIRRCLVRYLINREIPSLSTEQ